MKKMKKIVSLLLAAVMVLAMTAAVSAAKITIDGATSGSTYSAYKLLDATDGGNGKFAYTVNSKYRDALKTAMNNQDATDDQIIEHISGLNADAIRTFADNVYKRLGAVEADATTTTGAFNNVAQGYYLIAESAMENPKETYSLVMLDTAGSAEVTVTPKKDKPTLDKEIKHNETGAWGVVGDNQIGDTVEFRTITTVPDYTKNYTTYAYIIHDTMSEGLTSNVVTGNTNNDLSVKVVKNGQTTETPLDAKYISVTASGNTFSVTIDVKTAVADGVMSAGDSLYTYYTGILNEEARIYDGDPDKQENEAYLEYSNNPYDENSKEETPHKKVYDWTFKMGVNKVDGTTNDTITGAVFVLAEKELNLDNLNLSEEGVPATTTDLIALVSIEGGYRVATAEEIADNSVTKVYHMEAGDITIKGLDDATQYYLYETKAPAGYNKLKDPVKFTINAEYNEAGDALAEGKPDATVIQGNKTETLTDLATDVVNNSGTELPETGGIGTTIFYVLGTILVLGAAILLITKKRMSAEK